MNRRCTAALALLLAAPAARAEVVQLELERREPVLGGRAFGAAGAYEKLVGTLHFALDVENEHNARIVDLALAPRDADGRVVASADLMVLRPVDPERANGTALLEVSNRGGKASLSYFQRARGSADPTAAEHFGDGFLMERGVTIVWVGWQFDVPAEPGRLRLDAPVATRDGEPIDGLVRCDWTVDADAETLELGHRGHVPYRVLSPESDAHVLTVRDGRLAERRVVPRERWRFEVAEGADRPTHVRLDGGFDAGHVYELVYRAVDPAIVGLGLAAVRDTMSWVLHGEDCPFPAERGVAVGISQTGRFLRHFLYQGFNTDEAGRQVFDGMLIHTAGAGRGSFNHRFAQPSRDAHRYSAFFYPTDLFPFSGRDQRDPVTGVEDGLMRRAIASGHAPKVFYTNTGYEYWGRAASLLHTTLDGTADVEPLPNERIYHLASTQHFAVGFPPPGPRAVVYRGNPNDLLVPERALLAALFEWVEDEREPPPSWFPRVADETLVEVADVRFPAAPGITPPAVVHEAYRADYGPSWNTGVVTTTPPTLGPAFPALVPQLDTFGNELAGVPTAATLCPLASYLSWHVRAGLAGGNGELTDFYGGFAPLALTEAQRTTSEDSRPSVERTWPDEETYLTAVEDAAARLIDDRWLLEEDLPRVLERARATWEWCRR